MISVLQNPDDEYDAFVERVDLGEQCPDCRLRDRVERTRALGLPLFRCKGCGAQWFDWITRPTADVK